MVFTLWAEAAKSEEQPEVLQCRITKYFVMHKNSKHSFESRFRLSLATIHMNIRLSLAVLETQLPPGCPR